MPAPLINGFPVAARGRRVGAALIDYGPVLLLASSASGFWQLLSWVYLIWNCVIWQGKQGQTLGKLAMSLSVMRPTPMGFEVPGRARMAAKTASYYFLLAILGGSIQYGARLEGPFGAPLTVFALVLVLCLALIVLWLTDRGQRTLFDRILGIDVLGVPKLQPIP